MITVSCQMFIEYEESLDISNQIIKRYEDYKGDKKIKTDISDKFCGDNVEEIGSEMDEVFKNNSINIFIKILKNFKREMLSNK